MCALIKHPGRTDEDSEIKGVFDPLIEPPDTAQLGLDQEKIKGNQDRKQSDRESDQVSQIQRDAGEQGLESIDRLAHIESVKAEH